MMDENLKAIQDRLDEIEQLLARAQGEMAAVRRLLRGDINSLKPTGLPSWLYQAPSVEGSKSEWEASRGCPSHDGRICGDCEEMWMGKGLCKKHHPREPAVTSRIQPLGDDWLGR